MGDWSYALYLVHVPIIRAIDATLPASTPYMAQWFATVVAPIAFAVFFGKLDLSVYRMLKRWVDRAGKAILVGLAAIFVAAILMGAGAAHLRAIRNWQAKLRLEPTGAKVVAALENGKLDLTEAAQTVGLEADPMLLGRFDNTAALSTGTQFLQGWAADGQF